MKEVEKFTKFAKSWWDGEGEMKMLHKMNPIRLEYIEKIIAKKITKPRNQIDILDFGCGCGILSESLAETGYNVVGFDANSENIFAAKEHAEGNFDSLKYLENESEIEIKFDVIVCMEVIEHIDDLDEFLSRLSEYLKENGVIIFSSINKTLKSLVFAKFAAEYILRIVPIGIHDFNKFVKPSDLNEKLEKLGLKNIDISGLLYNPFSKNFSLCGKVDMNYFIAFSKC